MNANGELAATRSAADITGPSIADGLPAVPTASWTVPVDAVSFVASAMVLPRVRTHEAGSDQAAPGAPAPISRTGCGGWPPS